MMLKCKKIRALSYVFLVLSLCLPVKAEKFYHTDELVEKIAISVGRSGVVKGKSAKEKSKRRGRRGAGNKVCEDRLRLLRSIIGDSGITDSKVSGIVGVYLHNAHLNPNTFEGQQLRKSVNAEDLLHNVGVLIEIYEEIQSGV